MKKKETISVGFLEDQKYWEHSVYQFLFAAEEKAMQFMTPYLNELYGVGQEWTNEMLRDLPKEFKAKKGTEGDNENIHIKLMAASEALACILYVRNNHPRLEKWQFARLMVALGADYQILAENYLDDAAREEFHRQICRKGLQKRWRPIKENYDAAMAEADRLWKIGQQYSWRQMTNYLVGLDAFKELIPYKNRLGELLKPIAEKYGKYQKREPRIPKP